MRKMFTRLFGLALLLCMMGFVTELSAQCDVPPLAESNVELVTDPADVCDSAYITYQVVGFTDAEYAFNLDDDLSGWGGFTSDSTVAVKEGVPFRIMVRMNDTCYSNELYYTDVNLIEPVVIDTPEVEHPQCFGDDGEVTIKFTGDHGPYTYYFVPEADWIAGGGVTGDYSDNTVGSAQVITGPGKYYVAVQDVKGCVDLTNIAAWDSAVVNDAPPALVIDTIYGEDPECIGGDGMVTVVVSGGYGREYEVTVGGVTETTVNDTAWIAVPEGSYTATAVDSNMCSVVSDSTVVLTDPAPITFAMSFDDVACADSTTGTIYVFDITGPADSLIYGTVASADTMISGVYPVNDTIVFDGLPIGYYELWLNNENDACDSVKYTNEQGNVIPIQAPGEIEYVVAIDTVVCYGDSSVISITGVVGGSGSYEYSIEGGDFDGTYGSISEWKVPAGSFDVAVRDAAVSSCEITYPTITLVNPDPVSIVSVDTISPSCPGGNDGTINITATAEEGATLWYSLDNENWKTNNIFAVFAGDYTVYVRRADCEDDTDMMEVTVPALDPNTISIVVIDSINECAGTLSNELYVQLSPWANQAGEHRTPTVYYSTDMGDIYVNNVDTLPFYDHISGGAEYGGNINFEAGTYYFWAIDNFGCVADNDVDGEGDYVMVTIEENDALEVFGSVTDDASCYGEYDGVITVTGKGGEGPYLYGHANTMEAAMALDTAAMSDWPVDADSVEIQVGKGSYWVVGYDLTCNKRAYDGPFEVDGLEMVTITDTAMSVTDIVCYGDSAGVIEVFPAEGGSGAFDYTLQMMGGMMPPPLPIGLESVKSASADPWEDVPGYVNVEETVYTGLKAGYYRVVVTDSAGCDGAMTGVIEVEGPDSPVYLSGWYSSDISCYGASDGAVGFAIAGGTPPYEYKINGSTWIPFPDIAYGPGVASEEVLITEPGVVTVWVRDSLGCMLAEPIVYTINEPEEILVAVDTTNNTKACGVDPNGELEITVTGGRPGVDYMVQVNDSILPGYVDSAVAVTYSGLGAGDYKIIVTELYNYCEVIANATITSPDTLTFDLAVVDSVHCKGSDEGIVEVTNIDGGTAPYMTTISGPVTATKDSTATAITFSDLVAGEYEVTVEDALGCTLSKSVTITEPDTITLKGVLIADITCDDPGSFSVVAEGGSGVFMYYADNSVLDDGHIFVPSPDSSGWQMSDTFTVTDPGTYVVWAYDIENECLVGGEVGEDGNPVGEWRVKVAEPDVIVTVIADAINGEVLCNGDLTDTIVLESVVITEDGIEIDDPVYTVTINGIAGDTLANVGGGTYVVMVTHEGGCYGTDTVEVDEPEILDVVLDIAEGEFTCPDATEGFIQATVSGGYIPSGPHSPESQTKSANGTENYSPYFQFQLWQDGELKTDYVNYDAFLVTIGHSYQVVVKDENGCTDTSNVITIDPVEPIEFELTDITCADDTAASVLVEVTGEPGRKYKVVWRQYEIESDPHFGETEYSTSGEFVLDQIFKFDNESDDDQHYEVYVVDSLGCESMKDSVTFDQIITAPLELTVALGEAGDCTTEVTVTAAGGVAPYTIMVNGEETTESVLMLVGGTYEISVMDAHHCMVAEEVVIEYGISADTTLETYTGEAVQLVVEEAMLDTMLYAGEYSFYYDVDTACVAELNVTVTERDRMAPVLDTVTPMDTIETNHAVFTIVFEDVVTFNDSVMGYLTVTQKDSAEFTIEIPITADMVDGNTVTVDYDYEVVGMLDLNTTYTVSVDSGIVMGDGLAWDGVTGDWEFTTGADYPTGINPGVETVEFSVYPNPFNDFIRIDNADKLDRVIVSNIAGQRILDIEYPSYEIRTGNLTAGVYVVTLIADDEIVKSEKFLKR